MTDLDRRYSLSLHGELVKLTPEIVDFKVGLFRSRSGFGRGLQAIGSYALPGDLSKFRKPGRSALYGAATPGGGGGGGRLGRRIGGERQYERCPGGFEFGGRFGKNCGRRLFKLPGEGVASGLERQARNIQRLADATNPNAPKGRVNPITGRPLKDGPIQIQREVNIPNVGPKNIAKRDAAVSAAANAVVSNKDNPALLVRRDGTTLAPSVPITDLGRLRRNADMENGIFVVAQKDAKTIGEKEIPALLSSDLDGIVFGFPGGGRLSVTKQRELTPSDTRRLNGAFKRGAAAAEELDYDAGIRSMVDASGGAIKYDARFPGIKRPYERVTVENAKGARRSVARWVYSIFLSATAPQRFGRTLWEIVESPVVTAIRAREQKSAEEQHQYQTKQNLVEYRTSSFQNESDFASFVFQVKRVAAVWDPDLPPSGGFRCPTGTRYGGRITDRFGRNCGWAVGRRLANRLEQIGRGLGNRLDERRDQRVERAIARDRVGAERRLSRAQRGLRRSLERARSIESRRGSTVLGRRGEAAQRRREGRAAERIDRRVERVRRAAELVRGGNVAEEIDERGAGRRRRRTERAQRREQERAERAQRLRDFADERDLGEGRERDRGIRRRRGRVRQQQEQEAQRKLTQGEREDLIDMVDYLDDNDPRRVAAIERLRQDGFNPAREQRIDRLPEPGLDDLTDEQIMDAIADMQDNKMNPRRAGFINEARRRGLNVIPEGWEPNENLIGGRGQSRRRRRGERGRRLRDFANERDLGEGEERDRQARERADARAQRRLERRARRDEARQRRIDRRTARSEQRRQRRGERADREQRRAERAERLREFADERDFGEGRERDRRARDRAQRRAERLERRRQRRLERRQRRRERAGRLRRFADRRDYGEGRERDRRIRDRGRAETIRPEDEDGAAIDEGGVPDVEQPRPGGRRPGGRRPGGRQPRPGGRQPRPGGRQPRPDGRQPRPGGRRPGGRRPDGRQPRPADDFDTEDGIVIDPGPIPSPPLPPRPGGRGPRVLDEPPRPGGRRPRPPRPIFGDDAPLGEYSDDELARMIDFLEEMLFRPTMRLLMPDIEDRLNALRTERDRRRTERDREPDAADLDDSVPERPDLDEERRIRYQDSSDVDLRNRRDDLERSIAKERDDDARTRMLEEKNDIEAELLRREMSRQEQQRDYDPLRRQRPVGEMSDDDIANELDSIAAYLSSPDNDPQGAGAAAAERRRTELADALDERGVDLSRMRNDARLSRYSDQDIRTEMNRIEEMLAGPRPMTQRRREVAERRLTELRAEMERRNAGGSRTGNSRPIPGDPVFSRPRGRWADADEEYWNRRAGAVVGMPEDGDIGQMSDEDIDRVMDNIDDVLRRADDPNELMKVHTEERRAWTRLANALDAENARRRRDVPARAPRRDRRISALLRENNDAVPDVAEMTPEELRDEESLIDGFLPTVDNSRDRAILANRAQEIVDEQIRRRRNRERMQRDTTPGFVSEDQDIPVRPSDDDVSETRRWHDEMVEVDLGMGMRDLADLDDDELYIALSRIRQIMQDRDNAAEELGERPVPERDRALKRKLAQIEAELRRRDRRSKATDRARSRAERRRKEVLNESRANDPEQRSDDTLLEGLLGREDPLALERGRLDTSDPATLRALEQEFLLRADLYERLALLVRTNAERSRRNGDNEMYKRGMEYADQVAALSRAFARLSNSARHAEQAQTFSTLSEAGKEVYWNAVAEMRELASLERGATPELRNFSARMRGAAERNLEGDKLARNLARAQLRLADEAEAKAARMRRDEMSEDSIHGLAGYDQAILQASTPEQVSALITALDNRLANLRSMERRAFQNEDIDLEETLSFTIRDFERVRNSAFLRRESLRGANRGGQAVSATQGDVLERSDRGEPDGPRLQLLTDADLREQERLRGGPLDAEAQRDLIALREQFDNQFDEIWRRLDRHTNPDGWRAMADEATGAVQNWQAMIADWTGSDDDPFVENARLAMREWERIRERANQRIRRVAGVISSRDRDAITDSSIRQMVDADLNRRDDFIKQIDELVEKGQWSVFDDIDPKFANTAVDITAENTRRNADRMRLQAYEEPDPARREQLLTAAALLDGAADDLDQALVRLRKRFPGEFGGSDDEGGPFSTSAFDAAIGPSLNSDNREQFLTGLEDAAFLLGMTRDRMLDMSDSGETGRRERALERRIHDRVQTLLNDAIDAQVKRGNVSLAEINEARQRGRNRANDMILARNHQARFNQFDYDEQSVNEWNNLLAQTRQMPIWDNVRSQQFLLEGEPDEVEGLQNLRGQMERLIAQQANRVNSLGPVGSADLDGIFEHEDARLQQKLAREIIEGIDRRLTQMGRNDRIVRNRKIREQGQGIVDPLEDRAEAFAQLRKDKILSRARRSYAKYFQQRYGAARPWQERNLNPSTEDLSALTREAQTDGGAEGRLTEIMKRWFELDDVEGRDGFKFRTRVETTYATWGNSIKVGGRIEAWDAASGRWRHVGNFDRTINPDDKDIFNSSMFFASSLDVQPGEDFDDLYAFANEAKGKDFANVFNNHVWTWAKSAGFEKIRVSTASDGPYVWGRVGFRSSYRDDYRTLANTFGQEVARYRAGEGSIIRSDADADMIEYLVRKSNDVGHDPRQAPAHFDYLIALGEPDSGDRKEELYTWFKNYAPLQSGAIDLVQSGLVFDDPARLMDDDDDGGGAKVVSGGATDSFLNKTVFPGFAGPQPVAPARGLMADQPTQPGMPAVPRNIVNSQIDSPQAAIEHIRNGGSLADVPNEFVYTALKANSSQLAVDRNSQYLMRIPQDGIQGDTRIFVLRNPDGTLSNQGYVLKADRSESPIAGGDGQPTWKDAAEVTAWNFMAAMGIFPEGAAWDGISEDGRGRYVVLPHVFNLGAEGDQPFEMAKKSTWAGEDPYDPDWVRNDPETHPAALAAVMTEFMMGMSDRHGANAVTFTDGTGRMHVVPLDFGFFDVKRFYGPGAFIDYANGMGRHNNLLYDFVNRYNELRQNGRYEEANQYREQLRNTFRDIISRGETFTEDMGRDDWVASQMAGIDLGSDAANNQLRERLRYNFEVIRRNWEKLRDSEDTVLALFGY